MQGSDKHFLNAPNTIVIDSLKGLCATNPHVGLDEGNKIIYHLKRDPSKVAVICGGGSGHEPAHAGYVGPGMLAAAVCGNVFASPNASQVRRCIELVDNEKGTLIVVKNYTGDVLNFGLAKETFLASYPTKLDSVKFVVVGDDVSVGRTQGSIVGRRGLAGTVLVYKLASALSQRGEDLSDVSRLAKWVASRLGTIGAGLEHCHVPGTETFVSHLSKTEVEIGMGIHNEAGHIRLAPIPTLHDLIASMLGLIMSTKDKERAFLPFLNDGEDEVILMVNNLGGLSQLELGGIAGETVKALRDKVHIRRVLSGSFMTSLNMPGFSLTLLLLPREGESDAPTVTEILSLIDEKVDVPGWRRSSSVSRSFDAQISTPITHQSSDTNTDRLVIRLPDEQGSSFTEAVTRACNALISAEPEITRMDVLAGDGDCGLTLKAGAEAVLREVQKHTISGNDLVKAMMTIAQQAEINMGGTSGALYCIFFSSLAQALVASPVSEADFDVWSRALKSALGRLYSYTQARPPSRTLVDPLAAFIDTLPFSGLAGAVEAASEAAQATKTLEAKAGRSAYVESEYLQKEQVPDPGAWGVKLILENLV